MKKRAAISEAAGAAVICAAAGYLHVAFSLSAGGALGLIFGAVNESVWEHAKILSAAYAGYAILQLCWIRTPFRRYLVSKVIGLYALMGAIIGFLTLNTALTGRDLPRSAILPTVVIVAAVQTLSFFLETGDNRLGDYFAPAVMLLMLYYLMFFSFSIFPPRMPLFRDPSGGYGPIGDFLGSDG